MHVRNLSKLTFLLTLQISCANVTEEANFPEDSFEGAQPYGVTPQSSASGQERQDTANGSAEGSPNPQSLNQGSSQSIRPEGSGTCVELWDCLNVCGERNEDCDRRCVQEASPKAYQQVSSLYSCLELNECQSEMCFSIACHVEVNSCLNDLQDAPAQSSYQPVDQGLGAGSFSCGDTMDCFDRCDPDDDPCWVSCAQRSSSLGWEQVDRLMVCVEAVNCLDWSCVEANCSTSYQACYGAQSEAGYTGSGTGTGATQSDAQPPSDANLMGCAALLSCTNSCGTNQSCREGCGADSTSQALQLFNEVVLCYQRSCVSSPNPEACINASCGPALNACQADR